MLQGILNQLLGGHVDHVIMAVDDVMQLRLHPVHKNLGRMVPVEPAELGIDQVFQVLHGVFDFGGEKVVGHGPHGLAHIGDAVGIFHHDLMGLLLSQIGEFLQHLVGGVEIQGHILVRVVKALGGQQDVAEDLVLRVQEMDVAGGHHHLPQLLAQADNGAVVGPQILVGLGLVFFVCQHKAVVGQGLDLQEVIEGGDAPEFIVALVVQHRLEKLSRLTGGADNQPLPLVHQLRLGNPGHPAEVFQVGIGDQVVEVAQAHLVLGEQEDVSCLAVGDVALGPQTHHGRVDGLQGVDVMLLFQLLHQPDHDQPAGHGVIRRPVVVEVRQFQSFRHDIQLEFVEVGQ